MSHSQLPVLFLLTVMSFSIFGCKEYNQSDFGVDRLVMSIYRVLSCVVGRECLGVQSAARKEQRNSSRKNEEARPKQKQHLLVGVSSGESRV